MRTQPAPIKFAAVLAAAVLLLALFACAPRPGVYQVGPGAGEQIIHIIATNFAFDPEQIAARQGQVLILRVTNQATTTHNLTVRDHQENILAAIDLPAGSSSETRIYLKEAGVYSFYCAKPFHSGLGMKGRIEAAAF
jgi:plastocyanin